MNDNTYASMMATNMMINALKEPYKSTASAIGESLSAYNDRLKADENYKKQQNLLDNQITMSNKQNNWFDIIQKSNLANKNAQTNQIQANTDEIKALSPLKAQSLQASINHTQANTMLANTQNKAMQLQNSMNQKLFPYNFTASKTKAQALSAENKLQREVNKDIYYSSSQKKDGNNFLYDNYLKRTALGNNAFNGEINKGKNINQIFNLNDDTLNFIKQNNIPTLDNGTRIDYKSLTPEQYNSFAPYAKSLFALSPLGQSELNKVYDYASMGQQLKVIAQDYNPSDSGLAQNTLNQMNKYLGLGEDALRNAKVRSAVQGIYNVIIKQTAGTAVSKAEEARLANELGSLNQSDKAFLSALRQTLANKLASFDTLRSRNSHYVDYITKGLYDDWNNAIKTIDYTLNQNSKPLSVKNDILKEPSTQKISPNPVLKNQLQPSVKQRTKIEDFYE